MSKGGKMIQDEKLKLYAIANVYGGSFDQHLAALLLVADSENTEKILATFPDEIEKLRSFAKD